MDDAGKEDRGVVEDIESSSLSKSVEPEPSLLSDGGGDDGLTCSQSTFGLL